jgi:hypothetical protein
MGAPTIAGKLPEPISLPELGRWGRTPSWPDWLVSRMALLQNIMQPHPVTGKYRVVPTLPERSLLNAVERDTIQRHVTKLEAILERCPQDDPEEEKTLFGLVGEMMLALPSTTPNEASAEARGKAFMWALNDLPVCTVAGAVLRWHRGDADDYRTGKSYDYHWQPAPAELRQIALLERWRVSEELRQLRDLLRAEPLIEYPAEHYEQMRARLAEVIPRTARIAWMAGRGNQRGGR